MRTHDGEVRDFIETRLKEVAERTAAVFGATATVEHVRVVPATVNDPAHTPHAVAAAAAVVGEKAVNDDAPQIMGGEDFSYMLQARPGAFIMIGQGDTASVHHPAYDFNDEIIPGHELLGEARREPHAGVRVGLQT